MNTFKTIVLLGVMTGLILAIGAFVGGESGLKWAFLFAIIMNVGSYWFSAPMALAMSGAQPISRTEAPELYEIVEGLARKAGIPVPSIHLIPTQSPNAFATGRDPEHAAVAVTQGILGILNARELEAVLAHELGHVRNRDILITTIAAVLASVITTIAHFVGWFGLPGGDRDRERNPIALLLLVILAPIAATLVNLAISRAREFQADESGAKMCGDPMALASALAKIQNITQQVPFTEANPAISSLFIMSPDPRSWFVNLLSTHPSTEERIARLQQMTREMAHRH